MYVASKITLETYRRENGFNINANIAEHIWFNICTVYLRIKKNCDIIFVTICLCKCLKYREKIFFFAFIKICVYVKKSVIFL